MSDIKIRVIFDRCHTATTEHPAPVEVEVYKDGKRRRFRTGVVVCLHEFKGGHVIARADAKALHDRIEAKVREVREYADMGMPRRIERDSMKVTFPDWLEREILSRTDITESTKATHMVLAEEVRQRDLFRSFKDLTAANIRRWDSELHEKGICQGSVHSYHKRLKTYINRAIACGLISLSPYTGIKISRGKTLRKRKYLTLDQVHAIERLRLTGLEADVKNLFLLSCYTVSIVPSTATPAYRAMANDFLMQLWQQQAISLEQLLQAGNFPFADQLLQSIQSQKEQLEAGQMPEGVSPQLFAQARQGANMEAVDQLSRAMRGQNKSE